MSFGTLDRHLKKQRWKRKKRDAPADGQLLPVEVALGKSTSQSESSCGLAVVLSGGRRIEVERDFDAHTFERLVTVIVVHHPSHVWPISLFLMVYMGSSVYSVVPTRSCA